MSRHDLRAKEKRSRCDKGPTSQHATAAAKMGPDREQTGEGPHARTLPGLALPIRMKTVGNGRKTPKLFSTFTFEIQKRKRKR